MWPAAIEPAIAEIASVAPSLNTVSVARLTRDKAGHAVA